jgi:RNA recognition motif-containing protein
MPSREGSRLFLGNLTPDVREKDVERFFKKFGRVKNVFIKNGRYGFCVSLNMTELFGISFSKCRFIFCRRLKSK